MLELFTAAAKSVFKMSIAQRFTRALLVSHPYIKRRSIHLVKCGIHFCDRITFKHGRPIDDESALDLAAKGLRKGVHASVFLSLVVMFEASRRESEARFQEIAYASFRGSMEKADKLESAETMALQQQSINDLKQELQEAESKKPKKSWFRFW